MVVTTTKTPKDNKIDLAAWLEAEYIVAINWQAQRKIIDFHESYKVFADYNRELTDEEREQNLKKQLYYKAARLKEKVMGGPAMPQRRNR